MPYVGRTLSMTLASLVLAAATACAVSGTNAVATSTPAALRGTWQVLHVATDRAIVAAAGASWEADDARLIGSLQTFDAQGRVDPGMPGCEHPAWNADPPAPLSTLLARDAKPAAREAAPSPADYGLHVGDPVLQPYTATCSSTSGPWFALLTDGRLLASHSPGTVLVLERITAATPMRASFDCTQASGTTEKTICASRRLAGLDLAVAAAYRHALAQAHRQGVAAAEALRRSQAEWRAAREACDADGECLAATMQGRVDTLTSR